MIYVIQPSIGGPVKIGYTSGETVNARVAQLQSACPWPLVVLRRLPGTAADERVLHLRFAAHRLHGEWFEPVGAVLEWLQGDHVVVHAEIEPQVLPLIGPLPPGYSQVLETLLATDGWVRTVAVARATGRSSGAVATILRSLQSRYGLAWTRRISVTGQPTSEWRAVRVAGLSDAGVTQAAVAHA